MEFISSVGIANMALSHVAAKSDIESLTQKIPEAIQCNIWYDFSRRQILEAHDWNFARRRQLAALHGDTIGDDVTDPLAGVWGFRYEYPDDCLRMRKIQNSVSPPNDLTPFDIETSINSEQKTVLTNLEDAVFVYTRDVKSEALFPPMFVQALSHLLASQIAWSISKKRRIKVEQFQLYNAVLIQAAAADVNESMSKPERDAEVVREGFGNA